MLTYERIGKRFLAPFLTLHGLERLGFFGGLFLVRLSRPRMRSKNSTIAVATLAVAVFVTSVQASVVETHLPLEVCELILTDKSVVEYFHVDLPERTPVQISAVFLHPDLSSRSLGYPFEIVPEISKEAARAFRLTRINVEPEKIVVEFIYPVEGLAGRFAMNQKDGQWVIRKRTLWEQ